MTNLKEHDLSKKIVNDENRARVLLFVAWSTAPVFMLVGLVNTAILIAASVWAVSITFWTIHAWYSFLVLKARNEPVYLALCIEQGGDPDVIKECKERLAEISVSMYCPPCDLKFNSIDYCFHVYDEHTKRGNKKPVWRAC